MARTWMIYGATGFTGAGIAREARALGGPRPILAGRDAARLDPLARALGCATRVGRVDRVDDLARLLEGVDLVLNAAGPFRATALPLAEACLVRGIDYLDLTAEASVIQALAERDGVARARGSLLLPAVGFDVVASDALAAHVGRRLPGATELRIGVAGLELASRGSIRTLVSLAGQPLWVARGGKPAALPAGSLRWRFDTGSGEREGVAVSWGDVVTAPRTTGIPDVTVYFEETPPVRAMVEANARFGGWLRAPLVRGVMEAHAELYPAAPSEAERAGREARVVAEARRPDGACARARLVTPEAYGFSAGVAAAVVRETLNRERGLTGFRTPGSLLGPDFPLRLPGVVREDLC